MYNICSKIEQRYTDNTLPRLVSFPRTGSHWLRIMLEDYLEMPCGPRAFQYPDAEPWGIHIHDRFVGQGAHQEGPVNSLEKVIYLHRDPIETIFSQLKYDGKVDFIEQDVDELMNEYILHLNRWRWNNKDVNELLDITYESMKNNTLGILKEVIWFLGYEINEDRICLAISNSSKSRTKSFTSHDHAALSVQSLESPEEYSAQRKIFADKFGKKINQKFKGLR